MITHQPMSHARCVQGAVDKSGRIHEKIERQRELHDMMRQQIQSWSDEKVYVM